MSDAIEQVQLQRVGVNRLPAVEEFVMARILAEREISGWRIQRDADLRSRLLGILERNVPEGQAPFYRVVNEIESIERVITHLGGSIKNPESISIRPSQLIPMIAAFPADGRPGARTAGFTFAGGVLWLVVAELYVAGVGFHVLRATEETTIFTQKGMLVFGGYE